MGVIGAQASTLLPAMFLQSCQCLFSTSLDYYGNQQYVALNPSYEIIFNVFFFYVFLHMTPAFPPSSKGRTGTSRATWYPRGNGDRPPGTQGALYRPIVPEHTGSKHVIPLLCLTLMPSGCTTQGDVGIQGRSGPPGPQGVGEPGPPVGKLAPHAQIIKVTAAVKLNVQNYR